MELFHPFGHKIMNLLKIVLTTILLSGVGFAMDKSPAKYIYGTTVILCNFNVDPDGGTFVVQKTNTFLDGTFIEIPPKSVTKRVDISVGYDDGHLVLRSGKTSGITLVVKTPEDVTSFDKPIKITVHFDVSIKPVTIIGYAIDRGGALRPIDTITNQKSQGIVSFYTFKPLTLTWVYVLK